MISRPLRSARAGPCLAVLALATTAWGCQPAESAIDRREGADGLRGLEIERPWPAPDFALLDTEGEPFPFRDETAGRLSLVFFGYTHCPDICPVQMSVLDAALEDLSYAEREAIGVVFVTTDPERDTPERLRAWLDRFDASFVGLRGPSERVNEVLAGFELPPSLIEPPRHPVGEAEGPEDETYYVGHATPVVAVDRDGFVRALYPSGVRQSDWRHDLPRLLSLEPAAPAGDASTAPQG